MPTSKDDYCEYFNSDQSGTLSVLVNILFEGETKKEQIRNVSGLIFEMMQQQCSNLKSKVRVKQKERRCHEMLSVIPLVAAGCVCTDSPTAEPFDCVTVAACPAGQELEPVCVTGPTRTSRFTPPSLTSLQSCLVTCLQFKTTTADIFRLCHLLNGWTSRKHIC